MKIAVAGLRRTNVRNCRALVLPHCVVQSFAPVAGLALGMGDSIDDDMIVEFFKDDVEGEDAHIAMADLLQ